MTPCGQVPPDVHDVPKAPAKKDLKCSNPQDDVKEFLERIFWLCSLYMEADTISGPLLGGWPLGA